MNILVAFKVVPDDQDVQILHDGSLDFGKAAQIVSTYDLNAIEAAALLAADTGGTVAALTVGSSSIDDSKLKKNVLARGVDELYMAADTALASMDAHASAHALAGLVEKAGDWDVLFCGDGSADNYAKQTGAQLASVLNVPYVSGVVAVDASAGKLTCKRMLETEIEIVEVLLPAVISVTPDIAEPRICGMKDILSAGKKPAHMESIEAQCANSLETIECKAPEQKERLLKIVDASDEGAIAEFAAAIKAAL